MIKVLYWTVVVVLIAGGAFGVYSSVLPEHMISFRLLLGAHDNMITQATAVRVYGLSLAVLELCAGLLLWMRARTAVTFAYIVLAISIVGCVVSLAAGDWFAGIGLLARLLAVWVIRASRKLAANR